MKNYGKTKKKHQKEKERISRRRMKTIQEKNINL